MRSEKASASSRPALPTTPMQFQTTPSAIDTESGLRPRSSNPRSTRSRESASRRSNRCAGRSRRRISCFRPGPACSTARSGPVSSPDIPGSSTRQTRIGRLNRWPPDPTDFGGFRLPDGRNLSRRVFCRGPQAKGTPCPWDTFSNSGASGPSTTRPAGHGDRQDGSRPSQAQAPLLALRRLPGREADTASQRVASDRIDPCAAEREKARAHRREHESGPRGRKAAGAARRTALGDGRREAEAVRGDAPGHAELSLRWQRDRRARDWTDRFLPAFSARTHPGTAPGARPTCAAACIYPIFIHALA